MFIHVWKVIGEVGHFLDACGESGTVNKKCLLKYCKYVYTGLYVYVRSQGKVGDFLGMIGKL